MCKCESCKKIVGFERFLIRKNLVNFYYFSILLYFFWTFCTECDENVNDVTKSDILPWQSDAQTCQFTICKTTISGNRVLRNGNIYCQNCYQVSCVFFCFIQEIAIVKKKSFQKPTKIDHF